MVLGLRPLLGAFVVPWLFSFSCLALDDNVLSWRLDDGNETLEPKLLVDCQTLDMSAKSDPSREHESFHMLVLLPREKPADYEPCLCWTIQHPPDAQPSVARLRSLGTSSDVLSMDAESCFNDCLTKSNSCRAAQAIEPKISESILGSLIPCGHWKVPVYGGKPPHLASVVASKFGSAYKYSVPPGEYVDQGEFLEEAIFFVSDTNGMLVTTCSIIDVPDSEDTPVAGLSVTFLNCRVAQPKDLSFRLRKPPRSTAHRFSLLDMLSSRKVAALGPLRTVIVAVCVSLAGTGLVAMVIYAIMKCHQQRKLLVAQDTTPRPFENPELATNATSTMVSMYDLTSTPILDISPARSRDRGSEARRHEYPPRIEPLRAGSTLAFHTIAPAQSQFGSSRDRTMQPHPSETLHPNYADPSIPLPPPRVWTRLGHPPTLSDPQLQASSHTQPPGQLFATLITGTEPQRAADVPAPPSTAVQKAERGRWLTRSTSEQAHHAYRIPHHYGPELASSGRHAHAHNGSGVHSGAVAHPTNHLRHWHSASSVVPVQPRSDSERVGGGNVYQRQDGAMQDLPPPYDRLVRSVKET